jgi:hypothetical protein
VLAPIAWVIGTPWADATTVGSLIGQKVVINEFVAYTELSQIVNGQVPGVSLCEEVADRHLCAVRLRQLQLDRDPDRRHRRPGPGTSPRPGQVRPARGAGRYHCHLHDGDHRRRAHALQLNPWLRKDSL